MTRGSICHDVRPCRGRGCLCVLVIRDWLRMQEIRDPYRVAVYSGANLGSGNIPLRSMLPDPRLKSVTPNGVISGAIVRICFRCNCSECFRRNCSECFQRNCSECFQCNCSECLQCNCSDMFPVHVIFSGYFFAFSARYNTHRRTLTCPAMLIQ